MADEPKAEQVIDVAAQIAGAVSAFPEPAAVPLALFASLWPILGPIAFAKFGHLFHHLKHSAHPQTATVNVLIAAAKAVEPYVSPDEPPYVQPDGTTSDYVL